MGKQYRVSLGDREGQVLDEMSQYWGRLPSEIIAEAYRGGISEVIQRYVSDRGLERPLAAGSLPYRSLCQAINRNLDNLKHSRIPESRLIEIRDGSPPTDLEVARLALGLGTSEEILEDLIACGEKECDHVNA